MDPTRTVSTTERTRDVGRTDGHRNERAEWNKYTPPIPPPPTTSLCGGSNQVLDRHEDEDPSVPWVIPSQIVSTWIFMHLQVLCVKTHYSILEELLHSPAYLVLIKYLNNKNHEHGDESPGNQHIKSSKKSHVGAVLQICGTRYVDGTPTSEVTPVTIRYIRPPHHGHTSQYHGHEWMTHILFVPCQSAVPFLR